MPVFDHTKVTVIFILGGPGSGKGTQCGRLVEDFNFCHISAGDLLRAEQKREGSQYGDLIRTRMREGGLVPREVTIKLLENAMASAMEDRASNAEDGWANGQGRFLIDGFPREMVQAIEFEETVCLSALTIYFSTTEEIMLKRLLERGKTSGREDDNIESIQKRFQSHKSATIPVIEHYASQGKVIEVDSSGSVEAVHQLASAAVNKVLPAQHSYISRLFHQLSSFRLLFGFGK